MAGVDEDEDMKKLCVCENAMNVSSSKTSMRDVSPKGINLKTSDAPFDNHSIKHEARGLRNKKSKRQAPHTGYCRVDEPRTRCCAFTSLLGTRVLDLAGSARSAYT